MGESMTSIKSADESAVFAQSTEIAAARDLRFVSLLAIIGFACFWAGIITVVASAVFAPSGMEEFDVFFVHLLFFLGFAGVQFLSYTNILNRVSEELFQRIARIAALVATILLIARAILSLLVFPDLLLPARAEALWFAFGLAFGLLLNIWGITWTQLDAERPDNRLSALSITASLLLAVALSVTMLFAPQLLVILVCAVLIIAAIVLQAYCERQFPTIENIDVKLSRQRLELFSRNMLAPLLSGAILGTALAFLFNLEISTLPFDLAADSSLSFSMHSIILISTAIAATILAITLLLCKSTPRFSTFERFIFPIFGAELLLLSFLDGTPRLFVLLAIVTNAVCYFIMHWNVLVALSYRLHLRASYHYAQGLISPLGGIALGWGAANTLLLISPLQTSETTQVVSLTLVFMLLLVVAITPFASNKEVEAIANIDNAIDFDEKANADKSGHWRSKVESVCEAHALTPREKEVFFFLAKGRNTEIIASQLFISTHTVKTHTARIYRKLLINSQQELINRVEEASSNQ